GLPDASRLGRNRRAQFGKEPPFDLDHLFLRVKDFGFVLLQLGRGKALGIDQRLLAVIIGWGKVQVRLRNFQVVAKDAVELDLERANAGALTLALLDLRDVLL